MGIEASREKAKKIKNNSAKTVFLNFIDCVDSQSNEIKSNSNLKKMIIAFYHSCKAQPENSTYLSLMLTGKNVGPIFAKFGFSFLKMYSMITKISLRASSLDEKDASVIGKFIKGNTTIKEIDLSENKLGNKGVTCILEGVIGHPRLEALILEDTHVTEEITDTICKVLKEKSCLKILRIANIKFGQENLDKIIESIKCNIYISSFDYCPPDVPVPEQITYIIKRNNQIMSIIDECISSPWHRTFRKRNDLYKSVKGRRMLEGKTQQIQSLRGNALFNLYNEAESRAQNSVPSHSVSGSSSSIRVGTSETVGLRETMEDFTVVKQDFFGEGTLFIGLFDGHGGREASEYVGNNFPTVLNSHINEQFPIALEKAFDEINQTIQPWCIYVGTTACIAKITTESITVANVGDTRCIKVTGKSCKRLTFDHKPDIPEEKKYIEEHGGTVTQGRLNGILAVSRSLGDSSMGSAVNSKPYIYEETLDEPCKIVFACDGVWDVMSEEEVADLVRQEIDPMLAARKLRDTASQKGSSDNISVGIVFVNAEKE